MTARICTLVLGQPSLILAWAAGLRGVLGQVRDAEISRRVRDEDVVEYLFAAQVSAAVVEYYCVWNKH